MEDSKITYYEHSDDLIDDAVVDKTRRYWPHGTVIFYAQRRHYLEIIPEFLVSLLVSLAMISTVVWFQPWGWFQRDDTATTISIAISAAAMILPWGYFAIETIRWSMDFLVLTNRGMYNPHFDFWRLDFRTVRVDWITSSDVDIPISYKISNVDVGTLSYRTAGSVPQRTPAVAYPHQLHGLIPVAEQYKPGSSVDETEWRD